MMLKCKDAVRLIANDEGESWLERFGLSVHLLMCDKCRRYKAQIRQIGTAAKELWQRSDEATITRLRDRILKGNSRDQP